MNSKYVNLFSNLTINGVYFKNRIISAPNSCTVDIESITRSPDTKQLMFFEEKAIGGAGAVLTNEVSINLQGTKKIGHGCIAVMPPNRSGFMNWVKQANVIARHGAVPGIELQHAGYLVAPDPETNSIPMGPCECIAPNGNKTVAMTESDMLKVANDFAEAAATMKRAGFKVILIHAGHGWLLAQFLSPAINKRTDEYGGDIIGRSKFPLMVLKAVKEAVGKGVVIQCRISGDEYIEGGTTIEDSIAFAKLARPYIDIIEVSAGAGAFNDVHVFPGIYLPHALNRENARRMKQAIPDLYVATVGAYSDPDVMEDVIASGDADFVCMSRQIMADPYTPYKLQTNKADEVVPCTRCLNCIGMFYKGVKGCDVNPTVGMEEQNTIYNNVPVPKRKVVIVGGGPGGMSAAIEAHNRGHEVVLLEKEGRLGGTLNYIEHDKNKQDLMRFRDYLIHMVGKLGIDVRLNTTANAEMLDLFNADVVMVAVGADPLIPKIEGLAENALTMREIYNKKIEPKGSIVIVGGGLTGVDSGISYAMEGSDVTIVEMGKVVAPQANHLHQFALDMMYKKLEDKLHIMTGAKCVKVEAGKVHVETASGEKVLAADYIINALGQVPKTDLVKELAKCNAAVFNAFGDCVEVGQVRNTVHFGYYMAKDIK